MSKLYTIMCANYALLIKNTHRQSRGSMQTFYLALEGPVMAIFDDVLKVFV